MQTITKNIADMDNMELISYFSELRISAHNLTALGQEVPDSLYNECEAADDELMKRMK